MEEFYKNWLARFAQNRRIFFQRGVQEGEGGDSEEDAAANSEEEENQIPQNPTEIVYESDLLTLIVEKSSFKKQKNFRLQDHLFKFKVVQKETREKPPILSDLFDFLHSALVFVLESVKTFYRKEDHNVAFLTLHQEPMINGLNTGFYEYGLVNFLQTS